MADFDKAIENTLKHEGGYVNDSSDNGGETNFGISSKSYPNIDIKNLTMDEAKYIYQRDYWNKLNADTIESQSVANALFDTAVNMGVSTSAKLIQKILEVKEDGAIGKITLKKLNEVDEKLLLSEFKIEKIKRYALLVKKRPANKKFLLGWINRTVFV